MAAALFLERFLALRRATVLGMVTVCSAVTALEMQNPLMRFAFKVRALARQP
mgnify:CR=1 FL=1